LTDRIGSTVTEDAVRRLVARLSSLDPSDREATAAHLLSLLDEHSPQPRPDASSGGGDDVTGRNPVTQCEWAVDLGVDGSSQRLAVDVTPGPTRIAKTEAATGRSLLSNGYLGADLIHVPAGEGFAPHTHPGDHLLFVLGGYGTITAGGMITRTAPGQAYMVEGAVPHAVGAITDHVLLAVGAPHRPLHSLDRQTLIPYASLLASVGSITCLICDLVADSDEALTAMGCTHSPHEFR